MKKILLLVLVLFAFTCVTSVEAKTVKVVAKSKNAFSTQNPPENVTFMVVGDYKLADGKHIPSGIILNGEIVKIKEPKRGKFNAVAYFQLKNYIMPFANKTIVVTNPDAVGKITSYKPLDLKGKSIDLGVSAAGLLVENISYPINFVRGAATATKGENKLKAGVELTYEKSMFSYFSKGNHIDIPAGGQVIITFEYKVD